MVEIVMIVGICGFPKVIVALHVMYIFPSQIVHIYKDDIGFVAWVCFGNDLSVRNFLSVKQPGNILSC